MLVKEIFIKNNPGQLNPRKTCTGWKKKKFMMDRIPESYMYWMTSKKVTDDDMEAIEDENVFNIVMFV
jgi:hypothetical protein